MVNRPDAVRAGRLGMFPVRVTASSLGLDAVQPHKFDLDQHGSHPRNLQVIRMPRQRTSDRTGGSAVIRCVQCGLQQVCLPSGLDSGHRHELEALLERPRPLGRGEMLWRSGSCPDAIYAVRAGAFKLCRSEEPGRERIVAFALPGELLGLDALAASAYEDDAIALTQSRVCRLPLVLVSESAANSSQLPLELLRLTSRELAMARNAPQRLGAGGRVARFLRQLSERLERTARNATSFVLPMSRRDIASFLDLAPETVSRQLKRLERQGTIRVHGRRIDILDRDRLAESS